MRRLSVGAVVAAICVGAPARADLVAALGLDAPWYGARAAALVHAVPSRGLYCGRAMTDAACDATRANLRAAIKADPNPVRDMHLRRIVALAGSEEAARAEWRARSEAQRAELLCEAEPLTTRCRAFLDTITFTGALVPQLEAARAAAGAVVTPFYTDGRAYRP